MLDKPETRQHTESGHITNIINRHIDNKPTFICNLITPRCLNQDIGVLSILTQFHVTSFSLYHFIECKHCSAIKVSPTLYSQSPLFVETGTHPWCKCLGGILTVCVTLWRLFQTWNTGCISVIIICTVVSQWLKISKQFGNLSGFIYFF